jgi:hypothetical protein
MYLGLHVECQILLSDFNQIWSFSTDFLVSPNIIFQENSPNGRSVVTCEVTNKQTEAHDETNRLFC